MTSFVRVPGRVAALGGVACVSFACSLLTPLDVFDGPRASDASIGDGAADGAIANEGGNADGGRFCGTRPATTVFCDDFDDLDAGVEAKWTLRRLLTEGGTITPSDHARSSPRALRTFLPDTEIAGRTFAEAQLQTPVTLPAPVREIRVGLSVHAARLGTTTEGPTSGYNSIVSVTFDEAGCPTRTDTSADLEKERRIALVFDDNGLGFVRIGFGGFCADAEAGVSDFKSANLLPAQGSDDAGTWTDYVLVASTASCTGASEHSIRVLRNGAEVECFSVKTDPTSLVTGGIKLRVGPGVARWEENTFDFDNVFVEVVPP